MKTTKTTMCSCSLPIQLIRINPGFGSLIFGTNERNFSKLERLKRKTDMKPAPVDRSLRHPVSSFLIHNGIRGLRTTTPLWDAKSAYDLTFNSQTSYFVVVG